MCIRDRCNACDFKKIRIQAEKEANQLKKSATLIDIYEKIKFIAGIENIDALMKLEIDIEQKVCQPNIPVINFYNYCLKCGKKVVITSDMYLPSVELEKILQVLSLIHILERVSLVPLGRVVLGG